jgi:hypothetical protein
MCFLEAGLLAVLLKIPALLKIPILLKIQCPFAAKSRDQAFAALAAKANLLSNPAKFSRIFERLHDDIQSQGCGFHAPFNGCFLFARGCDAANCLRRPMNIW